MQMFCDAINQINFNLNHDLHTATITNSPNAAMDILIPKSFFFESKEYSIVEIEERAFEKCELKSVKFAKDSVLLSIGEFSFAGSYLESISIPSSLQIIKRMAFLECRKLQSFDVPEDSDLHTIEISAFELTPLNRLFIPSKLRDVNEDLFGKVNCINEITVSKDNPFFSMLNDQVILYKNDQNFDSIFFASRKIESFEIPSYIKRIMGNAFSRCSQLKKVTFSDDSQFETIERCAFQSSSIEEFSIPDNLKVIRKSTFSGCNHLKTVTFSEHSELTTIEDQAFSYSSIEYITIPEKVTVIGGNAFTMCKNLTTINFHPNSQLEKIGFFAFFEAGIRQITIPRHVKELTESCLSSCRDLESVTFSEGSELLTIARSAFGDAPIEELELPSSIIDLFDGWCDYTINLFDLRFYPTNKRYKYLDKGNSILLKKSDIDDSYDTLEFVPRNISMITIPSSIRHIDPCCFNECCDLVEVIFKDDSQLISIREAAFSNTGISTFRVPKTVETIGEAAFTECCFLKNLIWYEDCKLKSIESEAFSLTSIEHFTVPPLVKKINSLVFSGCKEFTALEALADDIFVDVICFNNSPKFCLASFPNAQKFTYRSHSFHSITDGFSLFVIPGVVPHLNDD